MAELVVARRPRTDEDEEYVHRFAAHQRSIMAKEYIRELLSRQFQTVFARKFYDPEEEIRKLRKRVSRLESRLRGRPVKAAGDRIYEMLRPALKIKYLDKIVAIDTEQEKIVGVGDTIEEAYREARAKLPEKKQFYFRRVGKSYVERFK